MAFALLCLGLGALVAAGTASAQGSPAICDEYPDLPVCSDSAGGGPTGGGDTGPGVGSDEDGGVAAPVLVDSGGAGGTGTGGKLPFTGYPVTPLLFLLLLLLATGLAIRGCLAIHDRLRQRGGAAALPPPG